MTLALTKSSWRAVTHALAAALICCVGLSPDLSWSLERIQEGSAITPGPTTTDEHLGQDELIDLNFQDVPVRRALQILAQMRSQNLIVNDAVSGNLSMTLEQVTWDVAWELILSTAGLQQVLKRDVRIVSTAAALAESDRLELGSAESAEHKLPLTTQVVRVRYARAKQLMPLIASGNENMLSPRGQVLMDERTNALVITDVSARLPGILAMIHQLDIPLQQVMIEARIVTANRLSARELGINWQVLQSKVKSAGDDALSEQLDQLAAGVELPLSSSRAGYLTVSLLREGAGLDAELSAMASAGNGEVLARPKIITTDQSSALIESGVQIPYQETSRSGATSISFRDAVLSLRVQPQITPDQNIAMTLNVKQDTIGQIFNGVPSINTNEIETQVLVSNGATLVLGGIIQKDENHTQYKVPVLGDIPLIGRIFRRNSKRRDEQELLVFITPTVIAQTVSAN